MFSFNIILTEKCNAMCTHCYMGVNNKTAKKTMTKIDITSIINKFPKDTKQVVLTGGEVYLEPELLHFAIEKIYNISKEIEIGVESNGIWFYKNLDRAKKELENLKSLGVSFIRFSDDIFHAQGGVDLEKVRMLKNLETERMPKIKFLVQNNAFGIGRAETLPNELKGKKNCMNTNNTLQSPYLFLDITGDVFNCAWKCSPSLGNMVKDDWDKILNAMNENLNYLIMQGKIEEAVSKKTKLSLNQCKEISKSEGQCNLCYNAFKRR